MSDNDSRDDYFLTGHLVDINTKLGRLMEDSVHTKFTLDQQSRQAEKDKKDISDKIDKVEERLIKKIDNHDKRISNIESKELFKKHILIIIVTTGSLAFTVVKFSNEIIKFLHSLLNIGGV